MKSPSTSRSPAISVIIPCWKDQEAAVAFAEEWAAHPLVHEVIVAGVKNETPAEPSNGKIKRCTSEQPGRGLQMNLGAQLATGDVLLFHHVDSMLTDAHLRALDRAMQDAEFSGGGFYRKFDERHPGLRWLENVERAHSRAFGTIYGDQSVFVRRATFHRLGGFAPIPLMEDVDFSQRLRRSGKVALLDPPMQTSAEAQIEQGAWKITLRNLLFLILFRVGVSPHRLHHWYYPAEGENGAGENRWRAVPMCQLNQQKWSEIYDERLRDPKLRDEPQVAGVDVESG